MSNRKSNYNSLESMIREMEATSTTAHMPDKINIINMNSRAQSGGSKYNSQLPSDNSYTHVNKLLSMLATDSNHTSELEVNLGNSLKMSGGRVSTKLAKADELEAFFKKYNIHEVNGIKTKHFIKSHGVVSDETTTNKSEPSNPTDKSETSETSETSKLSNPTETLETPYKPDTSDTEQLPVAVTTTEGETDNGLHGGGMNPGFQAFLNLKKKIAEQLKISNGPKAAKIAGAVQKEMKAKYTNLNSIQIAEKGLEHFKKNYDKYKKMV
jgi:hypothetical protein